MTTSLWIWTGFHFLALMGTMRSTKPNASATSALVVLTWLAFGAMLWTGHHNLFLWTNMPLLAVMALSGLVHLGKPPTPDNEEQAASALWGSVFRLALVLVCWLTA